MCEKLPRSHNYVRSIFDKYDKNNDGHLSINEFYNMVNNDKESLPRNIVEKIHSMHDVNGDKKLDFPEFTDLFNNPNSTHIFKYYINLYVKAVVPKITKKLTEEESYCKLTLGMLSISTMLLTFYLIDILGDINLKSIINSLKFDPEKKNEIWRFITYMFVHYSVLHVLFNVLVQIFLGIPLEMVHGWWRVLIVYISGILTGSLATAVMHPKDGLIGASGGVYALLTAHIASIIMNYRETNLAAFKLLIFVIIAGSNTFYVIYNYDSLTKNNITGYAAHLGGSLAGLLVGINTLRNLKVHKFEVYLWYISFAVYIFLLAFCVIWIVATSHNIT